MKNNHLIAIALITVLLASCGAQTGNGYIAPQQINEPTISEITPVFETQTERVNNCDGANPIYVVSYKTIQAQKATFEVSVGGGGLVTGTPIPSILEVQLEAKITAALAKDYGLTIEKGHDLTLNNDRGTYLEHTITWKVTRVKGILDVIYENGKAQVMFDKVANVELYDRTSTPVSNCASTALPINSNTPTALPSFTLAPTKSSTNYGKIIYNENFDNSSGWNVEPGMKIENGKLIVFPGNDAVPENSKLFEDFILESQVTFPSSGSMAFYLRHQSPPCPGWNCSIQIALYFDSRNEVAARRFLGDNQEAIDIIKSTTPAFRSSQSNKIVVRVHGNNYEVFVNDVFVFSFTDEAYSEGLITIDNAQVSTGNIEVDYIRLYEIP